MEYLIIFGIILVVWWWRGRSNSKPGHGPGNVFGGWTWARGGRPEVFGGMTFTSCTSAVLAPTNEGAKWLVSMKHTGYSA